MDRADLVRKLAAMTDDEYRDVTTEARGDTAPEEDSPAQQFAALINQQLNYGELT